MLLHKCKLFYGKRFLKARKAMEDYGWIVDQGFD